MSWPPPPPPPPPFGRRQPYPPTAAAPASASGSWNSNYPPPPPSNNNVAPAAATYRYAPPPPPSSSRINHYPPPPSYSAAPPNYSSSSTSSTSTYYPVPPPPTPTPSQPTSSWNRYPPPPSIHPPTAPSTAPPHPTATGTATACTKTASYSSQSHAPKIEPSQLPRPNPPGTNNDTDDDDDEASLLLQFTSNVVPSNKLLAERTLGTSLMPLICQPFRPSTTTTTTTTTTIEGVLPNRCPTCQAHDNCYNAPNTCCLCGATMSTNSIYTSPTTLHTTAANAAHATTTTSNIQHTTLILAIVLDSTIHHPIKTNNHNHNNDDNTTDDILQIAQQFIQSAIHKHNVVLVIFSSNRVYIPYCHANNSYWQIVTSSVSHQDFVIPLPLHQLYLQHQHLEYLFTHILPNILQHNPLEPIVDHSLYLKFLVHFGGSNCHHLNSFSHACLISPVAIYNASKNNTSSKLWNHIANTAIHHNVTLHVHHMAAQFAKQTPSQLMELIQITNGSFTTISNPTHLLSNLRHITHYYTAACMEEHTHPNNCSHTGGSSARLKIRCSVGLTISQHPFSELQNPGMCTKDLGGGGNGCSSDNHDDYDDDHDDYDDDDDEFYGLLWQARDEYYIPSITPHTTWIIPIHHAIGGLSKKKEYVYVQMALRYMVANQQYLKIHTLRCKITHDVPTWFRYANGNAVATAYCRNAIPEPLNLLVHYRQYTSAKTAPLGQLILPEKLQLLPLIIYSWNKLQQTTKYFKSPILLKQSSHHNHHKALLCPNTILSYLYPTLYRISTNTHTTRTDTNPTANNNTNNTHDVSSSLSSSCYCSIEVIPTTQSSIVDYYENQYAYLLDTGYAFYLVHSWSTEIPSFVMDFIESKREKPSLRPIATPLIDLGNDPTLLYQLCIEDDTSTTINGVIDDIYGKNSYVEYLCQLHRKIRHILHPSD